jgi:hypothetical protein
MHINKINGKRYIGYSSLSPTKRWGSNGYAYRRQVLFYQAIQKYGWDNFEHIIIEKSLTVEEAKALEIKLIAEYKTCILDEDAHGYNMTRGGEGHAKYITVEEKAVQKVKLKQSRRKCYENKRDYYLEQSKQYQKEHRAQINERYREYATDPEVRKAIRNSHNATYKQLKDNIVKLRDLDKLYPDKLTTEEKYIIKSTERCRSLEYTELLLTRFI